MRFRCLAAVALALVSAAFALDGQIGIHDPSTIIQCDGKYYTFGTGGGGLISDDGWAWNRGTSRPGGGVAPVAGLEGDPAGAGHVVDGRHARRPRRVGGEVLVLRIDPRRREWPWAPSSYTATRAFARK